MSDIDLQELPGSSRPSSSPTNAAGASLPAGTAAEIADHLAAVRNLHALDILESISEVLGADVRVVQGGAQALDAVAADEPSVVLLDIGMPGMDGYEVARSVRARHAGRRIALVALTGWGQDEDRRRAQAAGFDHHLVKPADIDALQVLLASLD